LLEGVVALLLTSVGIAVLLAACGGGGDADTSGGALRGEVLVSAATSLSEAFADVEEAFEADNPEVDVILNLAASSALREQIMEGAPVDVFASANTANMDRVTDAGEVHESTIFARNSLQIAVPAGNPGSLTGLEDFADELLLIGLCAEHVPCGDFARLALANAGVMPSIDTDEPDVKALLTKIEAGELDAGIVYITDVLSAGSAVQGVDIPPAVNVAADYPIAVLTNAPNPGAATAFVRFVLSEEGQGIMKTNGFASA
jgi:molybdate transport system substrate-binding protein